MSEIQSAESPHERRVTWSLMAVVVFFVLVMSCIVVWVTSSLIQEQRGESSLPTPTSPLASATTVLPTFTPTERPKPTPTDREVVITGPSLNQATWTPVPGPKRYVRFRYWKVVPPEITLGECIQLTWDTEFAASLKLYRDGELFIDRAPAGTTLQDCPEKIGYVVYRLVGWNHAGENNWVQLQVKVEPP